MTAREEFERYFLTRALAWRDTLDDFDAETVAEIIKLMKKLQREIRGELFDNADSLTDFRKVRIEQLNEWLSEVLGGAALDDIFFYHRSCRHCRHVEPDGVQRDDEPQRGIFGCADRGLYP